MVARKRRKKVIKHCVDCGTVLKDGYWRRCSECWKKHVNENEDDCDSVYKISIDFDDSD